MKLYDRIMKAVGLLLTIILIAVVAIVTAQVVFRYVLGNPLGWSEQICRMLFMWGIMLGIPVVFYEKSDLVFDVLFQSFSKKVQRILSLIFIIVTIAFCVFYFAGGVDLMLKTGSRMTSGINMPLNVLYAAQPVSAVLLGIVFLERLIRWFKEK